MTDKEDKIILSRAEDAIYLAEKNYQLRTVGFLNPHQRSLLIKNTIKKTDVKIFFEGGYIDAERTLFIAMPEFFEFDISEVISVIKVSGRDLNTLSHRDYLGSLMGLLIKRENIGDILVNEDGAYIFVKTEIADYIVTNLEKIGNKGIKAEVCQNCKSEIFKPKTDEIQVTVPSMRLDAIVSSAMPMSRAKAQKLIQDGLVSVNFEIIDSISKEIKNNDLISVRGFGRIRISDIGGITRKARIFIKILKYK